MRNKSAFLICIFRKYMFYVQLYRKWACWGRYYLYFEALKGLPVLFMADFALKKIEMFEI